MASAQSGSRLGTRFGPYELHELIGMGGMGEVYRAFDTTKERMVALKVLRADMAADTSYQARFRRESRMARHRSSGSPALETRRRLAVTTWSAAHEVRRFRPAQRAADRRGHGSHHG